MSRRLFAWALSTFFCLASLQSANAQAPLEISPTTFGPSVHRIDAPRGSSLEVRGEFEQLGLLFGDNSEATVLWLDRSLGRIVDLPLLGPRASLAVRSNASFEVWRRNAQPREMERLREEQSILRGQASDGAVHENDSLLLSARDAIAQAYPNASEASQRAFLQRLAALERVKEGDLRAAPFFRRHMRSEYSLEAGDRHRIVGSHDLSRLRFSGRGRVIVRNAGRIITERDIRSGFSLRVAGNATEVEVTTGEVELRVDTWHVLRPVFERTAPGDDALGDLARAFDRSLGASEPGEIRTSAWSSAWIRFLFEDPQSWPSGMFASSPAWLRFLLLERLAERSPTLPPRFDCSSTPLEEEMSNARTLVMRAAQKLFCGDLSGQRDLIRAVGLAQESDSRLRRVAQNLSRLLTARRVQAPSGSVHRWSTPSEASGTCRLREDDREFWLKVTEHRFLTRNPGELRIYSPTIETTVQVDGEHLGVHGLFGWISRVPIDAGHHRIESAEEILVQLPGEHEVPCNQLVSVRRERRLNEPVRYDLGAFAPGRVQVRLRGEMRRAQIRAGSGSMELHRATSGEQGRWVELPAALIASASLEIIPLDSATGPSTVDVRAFQFRMESPTLSEGEPEDHGLNPLSREDHLDALRNVTRALSDRPTDEELRLRRFEFLRELGANRLLEELELPSQAQRFSSAPREPRTNRAGRIPGVSCDDLRTAQRLRRAWEDRDLDEVLALSATPRDGVQRIYRALALEAREELLAAAELWEQLSHPSALEESLRLRIAHAHGQEDEEQGRYAVYLDALIRSEIEAPRRQALIGERSFIPIGGARGSAGSRIAVRAREAHTRSESILSAYLNAPPDAILVAQGDALVVENSPTELAFEFGCEPTERECVARLANENGDPISHGRSPIRVALDERQVILEAEHTMWVRFSSDTPIDYVRRRFELEATAEHPVQLRVAGPTALQIRSANPEHLRFEILRSDGSRVPLESARFQQTLELPVPEGEQAIWIHASRRESFSAHLVQLDSVYSPRSTEPEVETAHPSTFDWSAIPTRGVRTEGTAGTIGIMSAEVRATVNIEDVRNVDAAANGSPHLELLARAMRREGRFRFEFGGLARLRFGPPSFGAFARLDWRGGRNLPTFIARGRVLAQNLDTFRVSAHGTLLGLWHIAAHAKFRLYPYAALDLVSVGAEPPVGEQGTDPDVYLRWYRDHPWTLRAGLAFSYRPALDLLFRGRVQARTNSEWLSVDRIDLQGRVDLVAGSGLFPRFAADYLLSYRFADPQRPFRIVRHIVGVEAHLWHWWRPRGRVALGARFEWIADNSSFAGFITLSQLFSPHRGVQDLRSAEAPFAARLSEGQGATLDARRSDDDF